MVQKVYRENQVSLPILPNKHLKGLPRDNQ